MIWLGRPVMAWLQRRLPRSPVVIGRRSRILKAELNAFELGRDYEAYKQRGPNPPGPARHLRAV